jgi:hypothetical protein
VSEFVSLLPNAELLVNPYTGLASEPSDGWAESQGQTGYRPVDIGVIVGCHITGFGDSEVISHLAKPHDFDALVIENCHTVADAAEAFKVLHGSYPQDTDALKSLLPNGEWLTNPYIMIPNVPSNGVAGQPGQTGYAPICSSGCEVPFGYDITGFGEFESIYQIFYYEDMP